ncbi:hypothetical protein GW17_00011678 [Ensete ventricosum]|nr:hypothetical protein GW17_00011678 [Ensete ventricosum]
MLKHPGHFTSFNRQEINGEEGLSAKEQGRNIRLMKTRRKYHEEGVRRLNKALLLVASLLEVRRRVEQIDVTRKHLTINSGAEKNKRKDKPTDNWELTTKRWAQPRSGIQIPTDIGELAYSVENRLGRHLSSTPEGSTIFLALEGGPISQDHPTSNPNSEHPGGFTHVLPSTLQPVGQTPRFLTQEVSMVPPTPNHYWRLFNDPGLTPPAPGLTPPPPNLGPPIVTTKAFLGRPKKSTSTMEHHTTPRSKLRPRTRTPRKFEVTLPELLNMLREAESAIKKEKSVLYIGDKSMIRKRYMHLNEEILKENPNVCAYMAPSLDARQDIVVVEIPKLGKKAAV